MAEKPVKILLVEDNVDDARLVTWALSRARTDFEIEHVRSLADALGWLAVEPFDAIVADLELPDTIRSETVSQIRRQAPHVPLVVLTGFADDDAALASLGQGAEDYLVKDRITPEVLDRAIRYAIQRQRNLETRSLLDKVRASEQMLAKKNRRLAKLYKFAHHSVDDISHEFRTPLTVITEYVCLLRDGIVGEVSQEQARMLNIVADRADDLNTMVDDMLDVSKLKTGMLGLYRERCHVATIVDHVRSSLERKAAIRRAQFTVEIEDGLPDVYCDAEKVGRVIINLAVNAIKYCGDPGAVRLWARNDPVRGQVAIGVSDNGPGIDPAGLAKIFKRFNQADIQPRGSAKSFGLGLSIARRLVELNLGHLLVESLPEAGSTFYFGVPVADLNSVMPRYLDQLRGHKKRGRVVSLVSAAVDPATDEGLTGDVTAFLNCALRQNDLVFRAAADHWLIVLPVGRDEADQFLARVARLQDQTNRNRPHGPLPKVNLRVEGTWPVLGDGQHLLDHLQRLVGPLSAGAVGNARTEHEDDLCEPAGVRALGQARELATGEPV